MIGSFFSFGLISCLILWLVYTGRISIWYGNIILTGASFYVTCSCGNWITRNFFGDKITDSWLQQLGWVLKSGECLCEMITFYVWQKLLTVDCSSWAGYWSRENVYVRWSHFMWNSCQDDGTLKAWRYLYMYIYYINISVLQGFLPLRKAIYFHM